MIRDPKEGYVEALIDRLRDADPQERWRATAALARIGPEAVPALIDALQDEDWNVRRHAAAALAEDPPERAVPQLAALLMDVDWEVRKEAARALREAADPATAGALAAALKDHYAHVRLFSIAALLAIQRRDPQAVAAVWPEVLPCLGDLLEDEERRVRPFAALLAGEVGDPRAVPVLWRLVGMMTGEPELRLAAVEALGKIRTDRCLEPLRVALSDPDERLRYQAARGVGRIVSEAALWHLVRILEGADPPARRGASEALARIARRRPVPALRAAIHPLRRLLTPARWVSSQDDYRLYWATLRAIESATREFSNLPLPAAPSSPGATLPIPIDGDSTASISAPDALETGSAVLRPGKSVLAAWLRLLRGRRESPAPDPEGPSDG